MAPSRREVHAHAAAWLLLGGLVAGGLPGLLGTQRPPAQPDLRHPTYPAILQEVRARTPAGARIGLLFPSERWDGYSFGYFRACYFLAGRAVVPLLSPASEPLPQRFRDTDYLLAFGVPFSHPGFEPLWEGNGGQLLKRRP